MTSDLTRQVLAWLKWKRDEGGAVTIEYISLAAVVLAIISQMCLLVATNGVGGTMSGVLGRVTISFDGGDTCGDGLSPSLRLVSEYVP